MNISEIKSSAKQKIKGNILNLLWPLLLIGVVEFVVMKVCGVSSIDRLSSFDNQKLDISSLSNAMSSSFSLISFVLTLVFGIIDVAYFKYVLNFVRTGKLDFNDILDCFKDKWLNILIVSFLMSLLISIGTVLFIIPGIILSFGLAMAPYLVIDTDLGPIEALKESWSMMKGYKWNYFLFGLSFIGWMILTLLTFGILLIWVTPFINVAMMIYYDKLKALKKI